MIVSNRLLETVHNNNITILQMTPSVFLHTWSSNRVQATLMSHRSRLRLLVLGGEPFPKADVLFNYKHPKNSTKLFNIYGITEVSCWASLSEIENKESNVQNLGEPLSQTIFQVRNVNGDIVKNAEGFLYIGSNSRICVIDDEIPEKMTNPIFRNSGDIVSINDKGQILYKCRGNNVIKRYGHKINLSIVEEAIRNLEFVKNCYAVWDEKSHQLHLCLIGVEKTKLLESTIKPYLNELKPIYRPDKIHFLERFEFTTNGKLSLDYLREQCSSKAVLHTQISFSENESENNVGRMLRTIWGQFLHVGVNGFVDLGGTSVIALQISNSISQELNMQFPELIGMLLRNGTLIDCSNYVDSVCGNDKSKLVQCKKRSNVCDTKEISEKRLRKKITTNEHVTKNCSYVYKCKGDNRGNNATMLSSEMNDTITIVNAKVLFSYNLRKCIDASPTVFQYPGDNLCVTVGSHSGIVCTVELAENEPLTYEIKLPDRVEASVLVLKEFQGIVGCYNGMIYSFNLKTGVIIWKFQTGDVIKCTAISTAENDKIFFGSYDRYVYCLSVVDGSLIWKIKASNGSITASGCLHLITNSVLFGTLDGTCLAVRQSSGEVIWQHKLSNPIFVAPVVLHSGLVLFCSVAGQLCCFHIVENVKRWQYSVNGNVFAYLVTRYDDATKIENIILASQNKTLHILELNSECVNSEPALKYVVEFMAPIFATPWYSAEYLLVACTDGTLTACQMSESKPTKLIELPGDVFSSPVVHDDYAFVGCRDDHLYIVRLVHKVREPT